MRSAMSTSRRAVRRQQGSVFVVALLMLVLLTIIGLSLALVTETEMLLGGNERIVTETFYASEAGVNVVLGQSTVGATDRQCFAVLAMEEGDEPRRVGVRQLGYSVDSTALYPVAFDIAPYSKANEGRGDVLYAGFFRGSVRALRGSWDPEDPNPATYKPGVPREPGEDLATLTGNGDFTLQGQKDIDLSFYVSPIQSVIDLDAFDHPEVLGCEPHPAHP